MKPSMKLSLIAACDRKMGIGKNGTLPWKLKNEMAFFNKMTRLVTSDTKRNAVIMGRKTWESIPDKFRPLVGRLNIVLSKSYQKNPEGALLYPNMDDAVKALENNHQNVERVWVIGGSNVYKEAMLHPSCDKVYLTEVDGEFDCDTFFPHITKDFVMLSDHGDEKDLVPIERQEENGIFYHFRIYQKH